MRPPHRAQPAEPYRRPPAPPAPATPPRLLLRPQEAADALGISLRTLMELVKVGEIPVCRLGARNLRLPLDGLRAWCAARTSWPTGFVVSPGPEQTPVSAGISASGNGRAASIAANAQTQRPALPRLAVENPNPERTQNG